MTRDRNSPVLKTIGYLISALSVILLGLVSWKATATEPLLRFGLIAGMATSVVGMFCRWLSYELEKKKPSRAKGVGTVISSTRADAGEFRHVSKQE
jgi:hypothetical protein